MRQDMEQRRGKPRLCSQGDAQEDIADLRHRGIGDHPQHMPLPDGVHRAHDHAYQGIQKQHILDMPGKRIFSRCAKENLHQQENIHLGHHAAQHRAGRGRGRAVSVGQPGVEGIQGALDGDAHGHEQEGQVQRHGIPVFRNQLPNCRAQLREQQMAGQAVEHAQPQQKQAASQQVHDHIPGCRQHGSALVPR